LSIDIAKKIKKVYLSPILGLYVYNILRKIIGITNE